MGRASRWTLAIAALAASLCGVGGVAIAKDTDKKAPRAAGLAKAAASAPSAPAVVVRRTMALESAMRTALSRSAGMGPKATVTVVIDPTPAVRHAEKAIGDALAAYSPVEGRPTSWQVATLGGSPSSVVADPASLRGALPWVISQRGKSVRDTIGSLRKTIKKTPGPGLVVYLAHGHFEDDCDLEGFIDDLLAQKKTLCVIGSEAAFEWAWGDVVADVGDWKFEKGDFKTTVAGVGNRPFGPEDATAPWHGGDTASPMAPICLAQGAMWKRETPPDAVTDRKFMEDANDDVHGPPDPAKDPTGFDRFARRFVEPPDRERDPSGYRAWLDSLGPAPNVKEWRAFHDWMDRLRASAPPALPEPDPFAKPTPTPGVMDDDRPVHDDVAVPSGFGPYGLMRAAGASGGAYILWGWSRAHRCDSIRYSYARCDATAPDLRARSEIAADIAKQPLFEALLSAWMNLNAGGGPRGSLVACTSPWRSGASAPVEGTLEELYLVGIIADAKNRDEQAAAAGAALSTVASVRTALESALGAAKDASVGPARRLRADVELTIHVLETVEYQITEYRSHLQTLDAAWWKKNRGKQAYVKDVEWVKPAESDEPVATTGARPREAAASQKILESRKAFLAKWNGTPFGAMVSRNSLLTFEVDIWREPKVGDGIPSAPGSGSSTGTGGPSTGGSTGGGGPTTGK